MTMRLKHLIILVALLLAPISAAAPALAGGVVTVCDEAHLLATLAGGGTVTFACSGTIMLTSTITIAADTTIDGSGQEVTISGNDAVRVFTVNEGVTLSLNRLTVAHGYTVSSGGGIYSYGGTLNVSSSTFSGNTAISGGGGIRIAGVVTVSNSIFEDNHAGGGTASGGGIMGGLVTVSNSIFSDNSASDDGGGIRAIGLIVSNSTFSGNSAGNGGGIYAQGEATVSNSTFSDNNGGAIGVFHCTLTVSNSTFSGNSASSGGGINDVDGDYLTVSNSTFTGNKANYGGGGGINAILIGEATVDTCVFSNNSARFNGGGIYVDIWGAVSVSQSTFSENSAGSGGGISNNSPYGQMTTSNSTFLGNRAEWEGSGISNLHGALTVSNSTFSGNGPYSSARGSRGGGIANLHGGTVTLTNSTFSGNSGEYGGGIYNGDSPYNTVTLLNTIVANSLAGGNCYGTITDGGGNLSFPDATCPGINADPLLGPLRDNGGPTWTMALAPSSAAIDAADDATCAADPVNNRDQRGVVRPQGVHCDIGAFERPIKWLPIMLVQ
jgi:predicted outer membrane repeat protein